MNNAKARMILNSTRGKFFGVTFTKDDGSTRVLNGRTGVSKYVTGTGLGYNPTSTGNVIVFEPGVGYRTVKLSRVKSIRFRGREYK